MLRPLQFGAALALFCAAAGLPAESPQLSSEQTKVLDSARASALQYSHRLPDFICTQITHRSVMDQDAFSGAAAGISGRGALPLSTMNPDAGIVGREITELVTFFDQKESYDVIEIDGRKVSGIDHMQFEGAVTAGEFGTALHDIFDPASHAVFRWEKIENLHNRRAWVFGFHVPKESGTIVVHKNPDQQIIVPYSGQVFVDPDTFDVLRIHSTLDLPSGFPIQSAETIVDYQPVAIAGKSWILPVRSEVRMRDNAHLYVNTIDFRDYHKFAVESTIQYGAEPH